MYFIDKMFNSLSSQKVGEVTWYYHPNWILLDAPQTGEDWHLYRRGRATGSRIGYIIGHGNRRFSTPEEELQYLSGQKEKIFEKEQLINMKNGTLREPFARDYYCQLYNVISIEVGIVFPTWETRIGSSVDGLVIDPIKLNKSVEDYNPAELILLADGILEIKSPKRMYWPLLNYCNKSNKLPTDNEISDSSTIYKEYYRHIWQSHFDQMQHGMAVLGKQWCDYVVYAQEGTFHQRIPYCYKYYIDTILIPLRRFLNDELDPLLIPGHRAVIPKEIK